MTGHPLSADAVRAMLKSQYHASLAMLRECIEGCDDELWDDPAPTTPFWQHAYHVLYFTHLYLQPRLEDFEPWEGEQSDVQYPDSIPGPPDRASTLPLIPEPYTRAEVLAYWSACDAMVDRLVDALDLASPESGFDWYRIPKLEHQMVNLRHIQHHTAQLADRLRAARGVGISWVKAAR